jgi:hypothetical protein
LGNTPPTTLDQADLFSLDLRYETPLQANAPSTITVTPLGRDVILDLQQILNQSTEAARKCGVS